MNRTPLDSVQIARRLSECDRRGLAGADRVCAGWALSGRMERCGGPAGEMVQTRCRRQSGHACAVCASRVRHQEGYGLYWYCLELVARGRKTRLSFGGDTTPTIAADTGIHQSASKR